MAEYIFTDLPRYIRVTSRTEFSSSVVHSGSVLLFSEDGSSLTAKLPDGSFITVGGSGGTDVSDTTATAATVLSGYDFYLASGIKATGSIQTVTASQSGNIVTVPAGYIASQQTITVGTAKAAATYTPGTTDQTITAGQYLTGDQTIKGDANLLAANIVQGVTIFGVTGTASGGSDFYKCASVTAPGIQVSGAGDDRVNGLYTDTGQTMNGEPIYSLTKNGYTSYYYRTSDSNWRYVISPQIYDGNHNAGEGTAQYHKADNSAVWEPAYYGTAPGPTVTEVIPENPSWSGYKAVQDPVTGAWSFSETVTSGLEYTGFIPEIGSVYNADATAKLDLYTQPEQ